MIVAVVEFVVMRMILITTLHDSHHPVVVTVISIVPIILSL